MTDSEVEVLYECLICGKAFSKLQGLRGHMRIHPGHGFVRTTIWANSDKWSKFKALCTKHKTTTCHLLDVLIEAALKGDETGIVNLGSPNPLVINMTHVFMGRPRSGLKIEVPEILPRGPHCPTCLSEDVNQWNVPYTDFLEGNCRKCGAKWTIEPHHYPR